MIASRVQNTRTCGGIPSGHRAAIWRANPLFNRAPGVVSELAKDYMKPKLNIERESKLQKTEGKTVKGLNDSSSFMKDFEIPNIPQAKKKLCDLQLDTFE